MSRVALAPALAFRLEPRAGGTPIRDNWINIWILVFVKISFFPFFSTGTHRLSVVILSHFFTYWANFFTSLLIVTFSITKFAIPFLGCILILISLYRTSRGRLSYDRIGINIQIGLDSFTFFYSILIYAGRISSRVSVQRQEWEVFRAKLYKQSLFQSTQIDLRTRIFREMFLFSFFLLVFFGIKESLTVFIIKLTLSYLILNSNFNIFLFFENCTGLFF